MYVFTQGHGECVSNVLLPVAGVGACYNASIVTSLSGGKRVPRNHTRGNYNS